MIASPSKELNVARPLDGKTSFSGSAIKGSSLLNTVGDIRSFVQRGTSILINNVSYEVSLTGEWNSNSVQLTTDYSGETNFEVNIYIPPGSFSPKRKKTSASLADKNVNLHQMVQGLDSITERFGAKLKQQDADTSDQHKTSNKRTTKNRATAAEAAPTMQQKLQTQSQSQPQFSSIPLRKPKTLPPLLPISSNAVSNAVPGAEFDEEQDDDSIDADRDNAAKKNSKARLPPKLPQEGLSQRSDAAKDVAQPRQRLPKRPKVQIQDQTPPPLPVNNERRGLHKVTTQNSDEHCDSPASSLNPQNTKTVEEQRRAALLRVQQKIKEDTLQQEKLAAAKEREIAALKEASANKAKELQNRTAARVEKYMAEKNRKLENQKELERYEEEQRILKNQQYLSSSRHLRMKDLRKDASRRLQQLAYEDLVKAQIAEEQLQKSLFERHKKYDVNTTFLPRLDGGSLAQGSSNSVADSANPPPGRVVKSLAKELEQFELDSHKFPEEPVLRSRSAKQAGGRQNSKPGVAAPRSGSLPAIAGAQKIGINSSSPVALKKVQHSIPQSTNSSAKAKALVPALPPRDEDEWSDDEPDLLQEAAMHAQANRRSDDPDEPDEDSLGGDDEAGEDDIDAEMERQLFGAAQVPIYAQSTPAIGAGGFAPHPQHQLSQMQSNYKPPTGKVTKVKSKRNGGEDFDDDASDCSDITIDSVLGGGGGGGGRRKPNKPTARVKTPVRSVVKTMMSPTGGALPSIHHNVNNSFNNSAVRHAPLQSAPPSQLQQMQQAQQMQNTQQQMQQQVIFAPRAPPPLPHQQQQQQQIQQQQQASGYGSSPSVSPAKSKVKPFRKLKPIPISSEYRPVVNTVY